MDEISVFARPFAQAIAGNATSMKFNSASLQFTLEFHVDSSIKAPTEIVVPALRYPNGFNVEVSSGLRWQTMQDRKNVIAVFADVTDFGPLTRLGSISITAKSAASSIVV